MGSLAGRQSQGGGRSEGRELSLFDKKRGGRRQEAGLVDRAVPHTRSLYTRRDQSFPRSFLTH